MMFKHQHYDIGISRPRLHVAFSKCIKNSLTSGALMFTVSKLLRISVHYSTQNPQLQYTFADVLNYCFWIMLTINWNLRSYTRYTFYLFRLV